MKTIKLKAVAVGVLIDIGGSIAVGLVLGMAIGVVADLSGDTSPGHLAALRANFYLKFVGLIGTTFFTGLGGYVAARWSRPRGLSNALAVGAVSLFLGSAFALSAPGVTPIWKLAAGIVLTLPAAFTGGRVAERRA